MDLLTARSRRGFRWNQKTLADKSGVDQATISRLENGVTDNPEINTVRKLERALRLKRGTLVFSQREAVSA